MSTRTESLNEACCQSHGCEHLDAFQDIVNLFEQVTESGVNYVLSDNWVTKLQHRNFGCESVNAYVDIRKFQLHVYVE